MSQSERYLAGYEGDFTTSTVSGVLFLWQNWQHYFRLDGIRIRCEATAALSWEARGLGGTGEWYLTQQSCNINSGLLHIHNYISFLGQLTKFQTIFQYRKLRDGRLWYCGGGYGVLPTTLVPISIVCQLIASYAIRSIGRRGGEVASDIAEHPDILLSKCGPSAAALFQQYTLEEKNIASGSIEPPDFFTEKTLRPISIYESIFADKLMIVQSGIERQVEQLKSELPEGFDPTLLDVVTQSLPLGIPGAATIALRDFLLQHGLTKSDEGDSASPVISQLINQYGGRMRRYVGVEKMLGAELSMLTETLSAVSCVVRNLEKQKK